MYSSLCISLLNLKCKRHRSSFVECCARRPLQPVCIETVRFHIDIPKHAAGSSTCTWRITKSHSSPVHVNERQAPLLSSKTLLSADSYQCTTGLSASHGPAELPQGWEIIISLTSGSFIIAIMIGYMKSISLCSIPLIESGAINDNSSIYNGSNGCITSTLVLCAETLGGGPTR